jgi:hypothetical protein
LEILSSNIHDQDLPSVKESDLMPEVDKEKLDNNYWHQNTDETYNMTNPFLPKLYSPELSYNSF